MVVMKVQVLSQAEGPGHVVYKFIAGSEQKRIILSYSISGAETLIR
jgi:hypothetical protein